MQRHFRLLTYHFNFVRAFLSGFFIIYGASAFCQESSLFNYWDCSIQPKNWYTAPPDSTHNYLELNSAYLPLYYEWTDTNSVHAHDIQFFQAQFINQYKKVRFGLDYRNQRTSFLAKPVDYQSTHLQISENRFTAMVQIPDLYNFTPSAIIGYNTSTESIDMAFHLQFSGFHWLQPGYSYSDFSIHHETDFQLYESELAFRDNIRDQSNTFSVQSPVNGHWRYAFSYSNGKLVSPGTDQLESQNLNADVEERYVYIDLPSMLYLRIFGEYNKKVFDGSTSLYSAGAQFGKFNLLHIQNRIYRLGVRWKTASYSYQQEHIEYNIFGQIRGAPFTGQAVDLLGSAFSVDSQGDISIYSHLLSYSLEPDEKAFRFTADLSYNILKNDKLDYRTYALVFGFPRRETLQISRLNLDKFQFFNIYIGLSRSLSQKISAELRLRQLVPLKIRDKKQDSPAQAPFTGGKSRSYGGGALSLSFTYHF